MVKRLSKTYTLSEMKDTYIGKRGTKARSSMNMNSAWNW